jgi:hypothetical protein
MLHKWVLSLSSLVFWSSDFLIEFFILLFAGGYYRKFHSLFSDCADIDKATVFILY